MALLRPSNSEYPDIAVICGIIILINACTYLYVYNMALHVHCRESGCIKVTFLPEKICSETQNTSIVSLALDQGLFPVM